jgi:hypothetical protein
MSARGQHQKIKQRLAGRERTRVVVLPAPCFSSFVSLTTRRILAPYPWFCRGTASFPCSHEPASQKFSPPVRASGCSFTIARSLALKCRQALRGVAFLTPFCPGPIPLPRGIHDSRRRVHTTRAGEEGRKTESVSRGQCARGFDASRPGPLPS